MSKKGLIYSIGVNDSEYTVQRRVVLEDRLPSGRKKKKIVWACPYYSRWQAMLTRCYSKPYIEKHPTYKDCTVCEEWLLFSNFRRWMEEQEWEGMQLDKDILLEGNKRYSPEVCIFLDQVVNKFITDRGEERGDSLIGSSWHNINKKYQSYCGNPFSGSRCYLGYFDNELEAHLAWKEQKHKYACQLADSSYVIDSRVGYALRNKYKNFVVLEEHLC